MGRPRIIGIAGGSGSGKTTLARKLVAHMGAESCAILDQDRYYIDQSAHFDGDGGVVNFDHPDSLDFELMAEHLRALKAGRSVEVPNYDFATHKRLGQRTLYVARALIIAEGTLVLHASAVRAVFDASVFLEVPESLRFARRLHRDVQERGRDPEGVKRQWDRQVQPMHEAFVEPSKAHATAILRGDDIFAAALQGLGIG